MSDDVSRYSMVIPTMKPDEAPFMELWKYSDMENPPQMFDILVRWIYSISAWLTVTGGACQSSL